LNLAREQRFNGDAADIRELDINAIFFEEFFVFCYPERQHGAADRAISDADGCGVTDVRSERASHSRGDRYQQLKSLIESK
jgi:hypothetical protein